MVALREEEAATLEAELEQAHQELRALYRKGEAAAAAAAAPAAAARPATAEPLRATGARATALRPAIASAAASAAAKKPHEKPPSPGRAIRAAPGEAAAPRGGGGRGVTVVEGNNQVASFTRGSSPRSFIKRAQHEQLRKQHAPAGGQEGGGRPATAWE